MLKKLKRFFKKISGGIKNKLKLLGSELNVFKIIHLLLCLLPGLNNESARYMLWASFFIHLAISSKIKQRKVTQMFKY